MMDKTELSAKNLWRVLRSCWIFVLLAAVIGGGALGLLKRMTYRPTYSCEVSYYVRYVRTDSAVASGDGNFSINETLSYGSRLIPAFARVMSSTENLEQMRDALGLSPSLSASSLANMVSISWDKSDSSNNYNIVMTLTARASDTETALRIRNYYIEHANEMIADFSPDDASFELIDFGRTTPRPSGNGVKLYVAVGALAGALICYIVFFVFWMRDTRIKSEEDIVSLFDYPVIGRIPAIAPDEESPAGADAADREVQA